MYHIAEHITQNIRRSKMEKQFFIDRTDTILSADSSCAELKAVAKAWLDALGTDKELEATKAYIAELEDDVTLLPDLIALLNSEHGVQIFGETGVKKMLKKAEDADMMGIKYCICPACNAGGAILDNKETFLKLAAE